MGTDFFFFGLSQLLQICGDAVLSQEEGDPPCVYIENVRRGVCNYPILLYKDFLYLNKSSCCSSKSVVAEP